MELKCSDDLKKLILNVIYPVGSIYVSMNSTNPKDIVGGTWTQITNRFLYCKSTTSKQTGGSTTTGGHKLTAKESGVGSHKHTSVKYILVDTGSQEQGWWGGEIKNYYSSDYKTAPWPVENAMNAASSDAEQSHTHPQNLPPYITCYAWYRTA